MDVVQADHIKHYLSLLLRNSQLPVLGTTRCVVNISVQWLMWLTTLTTDPLKEYMATCYGINVESVLNSSAVIYFHVC